MIGSRRIKELWAGCFDLRLVSSSSEGGSDSTEALELEEGWRWRLEEPVSVLVPRSSSGAGRHHRDLMCSKLKVEVGFLGNSEDLAWLVTTQQDGVRRRLPSGFQATLVRLSSWDWDILVRSSPVWSARRLKETVGSRGGEKNKGKGDSSGPSAAPLLAAAGSAAAVGAASQKVAELVEKRIPKIP
ncbi:hypothetical protein INR49_032005 [Caranx melampygus]|nr:hypothetical protein INR49_032005 [Caranx melampygus]